MSGRVEWPTLPALPGRWPARGGRCGAGEGRPQPGAQYEFPPANLIPKIRAAQTTSPQPPAPALPSPSPGPARPHPYRPAPDVSAGGGGGLQPSHTAPHTCPARGTPSTRIPIAPSRNVGENNQRDVPVTRLGKPPSSWLKNRSRAILRLYITWCERGPTSPAPPRPRPRRAVLLS